MNEDLKNIIAFSKTLRVLYVEDNEETRMQMGKLLVNFFNDITIAVDGKDGLEKFNKTKYDIVISDINMPNMNGIDMISKIKETDQDVKVIIVSAHSEKKYLTGALELELVGYMFKPVNFSEFTKLITKAVSSIIKRDNITQNTVKLEARVSEFTRLLDIYGENVIATMTDLKSKITYVSKAFSKISGYRIDELMGKSHNMVRHPDMPKSAFIDLWSTVQKNEIWIGEVKNLKKDGGYYWVQATISPDLDEDGNVIGYTSIRQDITDKKETEELHRQLNNLFNNIPTGFLTINQDLEVSSSYSKECLRILSCDDIANKNISTVLFENDKDKKEIFDYGYGEILNATDDLSKELLLSLLPIEHTIDSIIFSIEYKLLQNNECLIIISDITAQKEMEKTIKYEQQMQKMIIAVATHKQESVDLKIQFESFLDDFSNYLEKNENFENNLIILRRELHTFKGLFSQKEMLHLSDAIHIAETDLEKHIENKDADMTLLSTLIVSNLEAALQYDIKIISEVLGENYFDSKASVNVKVKQIEDAKTQMHNIINKCTNDNKDILYKALNTISSMIDQPLIDMLEMYQNMVETIATKVEKQLNPLIISGDRELYVNDVFKPFADSLVHIFRNSIDHGIEDIVTREVSSKPINGNITCSFKKIDENILLEISDDGKGIDINKILNKAIKNNITTQNDVSQLDEQTIMQFIFSSGFTTNEDITSLSGRGVGLDAVMYELKKLNGTVRIESLMDKGTKFIFTIPHTQTKKVENIQVKDEDIILDCVIDASKNFLSNDIGIEVKNINDSDSKLLYDYFATVSFNGGINLFCTVSLSDELVNEIYNIFVPEPMSEEDKKEMIASLPNEIVNTVAGLAITKFPKIYDDLVMSEPVALDKSILESLINENDYISKEIQTVLGSFICTVIKLKD
ncbi:MAG: response regulator [Campylobacterota bacterium]|nr:response regulator [Campylobacterota bacterium]